MTATIRTERRHLWTAGAAASLSVAVNFVSSAIVSALAFRQLGPEALGSWALLWSTLNLGLVFQLGLPTLISPLVARYRDESNDDELHRAFSGAHVLTLLLTALWFAICFTFAGRLLDLASLAHTDEHKWLLYTTMAGVFASQLAAFYGGALDGFGLMSRRAFLTTLGVLTYTLVAILGMRLMGLRGLALAFCLQGIVTMLSMGALVFQRVRRLAHAELSAFRTADLYDLVLQGGSLQVVGILSAGVEWGSRILVGQLGSLSLVSYFDLALKLVLQLRNVLVAGAQVILVEFGKRQHANGNSTLYLHSTLIFMALAAPVFSFLLIAGPWISLVLTGSPEPAFINALRWISVGLIPQLICAPAYFALIAQRRMRWVLMTHVLMVGIVLASTPLTHNWMERVIVYSIAYLASIPVLTVGVFAERLTDHTSARVLAKAFALGGLLWLAGISYAYVYSSMAAPWLVSVALAMLCAGVFGGFASLTIPASGQAPPTAIR